MRATMAAAAALAGGLFLLATAHGPASAMSAPINLKNIIGTIPGSVELARQGGGGAVVAEAAAVAAAGAVATAEAAAVATAVAAAVATAVL